MYTYTNILVHVVFEYKIISNSDCLNNIMHLIFVMDSRCIFLEVVTGFVNISMNVIFRAGFKRSPQNLNRFHRFYIDTVASVKPRKFSMCF
jgi:hypothetical protein